MAVEDILKNYFGFNEFKEGQKGLIDSILQGRDCLGVMPTGGGKSLCYQLPSLLMEGIVIVISPLISLMKDQVESLEEMGINSTYINSSLDSEEYFRRVAGIRQGDYRLVYIAPERLASESFLGLARSIDISMIAIDEAHCISKWGHDFRPSYLEIPRFIEKLDSRPVISSFTGTATEDVAREIEDILGLRNPMISVIGFDRPNLYYQVIKPVNKQKYLLEYLDENYRDASGIIYCSTRKTVDSLVNILDQEGYAVTGYHGGMRDLDRDRSQDDFIFNRKRIIVATNAFGMGIDKPDVRFVIHYNMPKNMEAYYQEAGRAGRDGKKAHCILLYSSGDIVKQKLIIQSNNAQLDREKILYENLQYLVDYCNTNECLRKKILNYFGEDYREEGCGYCSNCLSESEMVDITEEAQKVLSCIYRMNEQYGVTLTSQVLKGSKNKRVLSRSFNSLSTYGIMQDYRTETIKEIIMALVSMGYINISLDKYPILKLTEKSVPILMGEEKVYHKKDLLYPPQLEEEPDSKLLEDLKSYRAKLAREKNIAPFMIFHDSTLEELSLKKPKTEKELLEIKGMGMEKYRNYGEELIDLINKETINESYLERYLKSYGVYRKGYSLEEIASKRGFTSSTIINHLDKCEEIGYRIDWTRFLDRDKEEKILDLIREKAYKSLKDLKDDLDSSISYDDIRISLIKNKISI